MKPVRFSNHARNRMELRGASEAEIIEAIQEERWKPALNGKWQAQKKFKFDQTSPVNRQKYAFKSVRAIFVDEPDSIIVITVIVYYGNEE
jgi:hypothetical protein